MKKRIFSIVLALVLCCSTVFAANSYFTDVASDTKLCDAVNKLYEAKIILGYGDLTFRPNNPITRAELCKIVNMIFNYSDKAENTFTDVTTDDWYYGYVLAAKKAGYIKGFEDLTFRGDEYVSREQFCAILNRTAKPFDLPFTQSISDEISDWAREDVYKIVANYLMPLEENNTFRATENITRSEVSLVLASFVNVAPVPTVPSIGGSTGGSSSSSGSVIGGGSSSGSVIGGSSGGSSLSGGASSGGSSDKNDTNNEYTNEEIIEALKSLTTQLDSIRFTAEEKEVVDEIKTAVNLAVESGESGTQITKEYVKTTYKTNIDNVKAYKDKMGEEKYSDLKAKLVRELDTETVNILNDYFIS